MLLFVVIRVECWWLCVVVSGCSLVVWSSLGCFFSLVNRLCICVLLLVRFSVMKFVSVLLSGVGLKVSSLILVLVLWSSCVCCIVVIV